MHLLNKNLKNIIAIKIGKKHDAFYTYNNKRGYLNIATAYLNNLYYAPAYNFVNVPIKSKYYHEPLPQSVNASMILCQKQQKLSQKMVLLEHIAQLIDKQPRLLTDSIQINMIKQLKKWQDSTMGRMQKVATIAWIIKKLKLQNKLSKLYNQILLRIYNDEWYVTMQQSIKALQTYSDITKSNHSQQFIAQIFDKIQRNIGLTIRQVNMKYYQRILVALVQAHRYDSKLWDQLQLQVLRSLGMQYDTKTIFQIIRCFAISKNGSDVFYSAVQHIMYKGHAHNPTHKFTKIDTGIQNSGQYLSLLVETYSLAYSNAKIPLNPDFLDYLYKGMLSKTTQYQSIGCVTRILQNLPQLQFHNEQIDTIFLNIARTKQIKTFTSLQQIKQLYYEIQNRYGQMSQQINEQIHSIVIKQINRKTIPMKWSVQIVDFLLQYSSKQQQSQALIVALEQYIEARFKYIHHHDQMSVRMAIQQTALLARDSKWQMLLPDIRKLT